MKIHNRILSSLKEGHPAIGDNMGELRSCYAKGNKPDRKTNKTWHHIYVESKIKKKSSQLFSGESETSPQGICSQLGSNKLIRTQNK